LHPEFGFLHLSSESRRTMRVALAAAAFGIVVGAVGTLGVTGSRGAVANVAEQSMTVGSSDRGVELPAVAMRTATPRKWHSGRPLQAATTTAATTPASPTQVATAPAVPAAPAAFVRAAAPLAEGTIPEAPAADIVEPLKKEKKVVHKKRRPENEATSAFASRFGNSNQYGSREARGGRGGWNNW
jgi:hypothetical protein